jgi:hypothetical protein
MPATKKLKPAAAATTATSSDSETENPVAAVLPTASKKRKLDDGEGTKKRRKLSKETEVLW